jgi:competence protein ComGE
MLRSTRGFFLLDLLLSLSAWLMMSLVFLPILIDLRDQSRLVQLESKARQLMYEELQTKLISNKTFSNYTSILNGVEYQINWKDSGTADQKEVCVRIEKNSFLPKVEICGFLE